MAGKLFLVSGISRGLGYKIAENLLNEGDIVYGISRTKSDNIELLQSKYTSNFKWKSFDLNLVAKIKEEIFDEWIGYDVKLDGFVNNAAVAYDDIVTNADLLSLQIMYNVNVLSPILIVKNVIRNLLFSGNPGSIVHISSISVHTGYKGLSMYASTKGALEAFSKNTAREWGVKGIRSNCVVAGFMETDMSSGLDEIQKDRIFKRTSLKLPTEINSVCETVKFLLSDKARSITGQNFFVDSGTI